MDNASQSSYDAANAPSDREFFRQITTAYDTSSSDEISIDSPVRSGEHSDMAESVGSPDQVMADGLERILDNANDELGSGTRINQDGVERDMDLSLPASEVRVRTPTRRHGARSTSIYSQRNYRRAKRANLGAAGLSQDQAMHDPLELDGSSQSSSPGSCMSRSLDLPSSLEMPNTISDTTAVLREEPINRITDGATQNARTQQNNIESNKGSTSPSSQTREQDINNTPIPPTAAFTSPYLRAFNNLTSRYGDHTKHALNPPNIIRVIEAGDFFLREDAKSFLESLYLGESRNGLWYQDHLSNPTADSPLTERLFKSFHCAEIFDQRSNVDPVRLRMARILVYHYYEQLCVNIRRDPILSKQRSRGRDTASIATDIILNDMYCSQGDGTHPRTPQQLRALLQRHKQIGKRWSILIKCIGFGLFLICSQSLTTQM